MKLFLAFFLMAQANAQTENQCALDLVARKSLPDMPASQDNPAFMKMLKDKGYEVNIRLEDKVRHDFFQLNEKANESVLKEQQNKIYLFFPGTMCMQGSTTSISIGSWTKSSGGKWSCPPGMNLFSYKAVSDKQLVERKATFTDLLIQPGLTFKSREEADTKIIAELAKKIPSCAEIRKSLPEAGTSFIQAPEKEKTVVNDTQRDNDKKTFDEKSTDPEKTAEVQTLSK